MKKDKTEIEAILRILDKLYPDAKCSLNFTNPLELLVATMLSAQCTDERVNEVTKSLFEKYRSAKDYASVSQEELEEDIRPTGFYKNKAKSLRKCCEELERKFGGEVPPDLDKLVKLPGIGRKTGERLIVELKEQMKKITLPSQEEIPEVFSDAVEALCILGYKKSEAVSAVSKTIKEMKKEKIKVEDLIKEALKRL